MRYCASMVLAKLVVPTGTLSKVMTLLMLPARAAGEGGGEGGRGNATFSSTTESANNGATHVRVREKDKKGRAIFAVTTNNDRYQPFSPLTTCMNQQHV